MKTIDTLQDVKTEFAIEIDSLHQVYRELILPDVDEDTLRRVAAEWADYPGLALSIEIPQLLNDFYKDRTIESEGSDGARQDFATRGYDTETDSPTNVLDGWFTATESGSFRYAFAYDNPYKGYYPGVRDAATTPHAISVSPDQSVLVSTMVYQKGKYIELPVEDQLHQRRCIEQALFDTFLAAQRMNRRNDDEKITANVHATELLRITMSDIHAARSIDDGDQSPIPNPESSEGMSWIIPEGFAD